MSFYDIGNSGTLGNGQINPGLSSAAAQYAMPDTSGVSSYGDGSGSYGGGSYDAGSYGTGAQQYGSGQSSSGQSPFGGLGGILSGVYGMANQPSYSNPSAAAAPYLNQIAGIGQQLYSPFIQQGQTAYNQVPGLNQNMFNQNQAANQNVQNQNAQNLQSQMNLYQNPDVQSKYQSLEDIYRNPGINYGQTAQGYLDMAKDPSGFINNIMKQYTPSTGYGFQKDQLTKAAQNSAAQGGYSGTTNDQTNQASMINGLLGTDMQTWLGNVLGANSQGLAGQQAGINNGIQGQMAMLQGLTGTAQNSINSFINSLGQQGNVLQQGIGNNNYQYASQNQQNQALYNAMNAQNNQQQQMGYGASNNLADYLGSALLSQAGNAATGASNQNAQNVAAQNQNTNSFGSILGGLGSLASSPLGGDIMGALGGLL